MGFIYNSIFESKLCAILGSICCVVENEINALLMR